MSVPKKRQSHSRTRRRRSQIKETRISLVSCAQCQQPKQPHRVCTHCGYYRGRKVLKVGKKSKAGRGKKQEEEKTAT